MIAPGGQCESIWPRPTACIWTKPPHRCSVPGDDERRRASSGPSPPRIEGMAGPARRSCCSDTHRDAAALTPNSSLQGFQAQFLQGEGYDGVWPARRHRAAGRAMGARAFLEPLRRRVGKQAREHEIPGRRRRRSADALLYAPRRRRGRAGGKARSGQGTFRSDRRRPKAQARNQLSMISSGSTLPPISATLSANGRA